MKIFSAAQIRDWDAYTIAHEPVESLELMERASRACVIWLLAALGEEDSVHVFCGTGNNGGDGLAITRLLLEAGYDATAWILGGDMGFSRLSPDCAENRRRLEDGFTGRLRTIHTESDFPQLPPECRVIDALFGTGLNRPLSGLMAAVVGWINQAKVQVFSIDMPSGMRADESSRGGPVITATHTLSFQCEKRAFLLPENAELTGEIHLLDIGLHPDYEKSTDTPDTLTEAADARRIYRPRKAFSHKGSYGHALLIAGSYGKMGAAVLCSRACLRAGAGLVSVRVPSSGYGILQTAVPEAMCETDEGADHIATADFSTDPYRVIGIGPGLGTHPKTAAMVAELLTRIHAPMVLDADALNILSRDQRLISQVPPGSILTPHPKEFERVFGKTDDDFERLELQRSVSVREGVFIVLKGHRTCISTPDGRVYFNPTGNPGMATGGSGDVLTGILTGLLAQGYQSADAALLGVYLHGLAGDLAAEALGQESLLASDLVEYLGRAFKML